MNNISKHRLLECFIEHNYDDYELFLYRNNLPYNSDNWDQYLKSRQDKFSDFVADYQEPEWDNNREDR